MADYAHPRESIDEIDLTIDLRPRLERPTVVEQRFASGPYSRWAKPVLDRLGGLILSVITIPCALIIVAAILISIGRPAIYRQPRVGKNGEVFRIFKFRTMLPDRRSGGNDYDGMDRRKRHKTNGDPRHTAVGLFLRKWSLDEIPQFWNVALGQMSLVGPRPEMVEIVEEKYEPWQHQRHLVKPGVTGLWQISARSEETLMYEHTDIDLEYVQKITFLKDARILLLTVPAALGFRKGS